MAKKLGIGALILFLALLGLIVVIAMRPADFKVERTIQLAAPAENVFPLINDFHQWPRWSPYEKLDPNMTKIYEGPESGVGASYHWSGNDQAGEGVATIVASKPNEAVDLTLQFIRPFAANNQAAFTFKPGTSGTQLTWSMAGKQDFMMKAVCLFLDMDAMVGKDFEEGLATLNRIAQEPADSTTPVAQAPAAEETPAAAAPVAP